MPLRLEIKRNLSASSERVKCVDVHPQEPWILAALYSGHCFLWNYETQTLVKSFEVGDLPVRCARFIPKKQWIICGSDDYVIRVYNYNTMERVHQFEAHTDYIRCLAVHPSLPYVLSSSDDMYIKLWDWEKGWECVTVFEGHSHYVMQVEFNPKDTNTFASASLDRTVKVWGLNSPQPHFSLEGHERGVNCVSYFRGGDAPYLVSGADDHLVKVWDYQTKSCVATLDGHSNNVSAVIFHPQLPVIITGSEDGTVRIWHSNTYRLENTLNYGMGRVWSISCMKGTNKVAIGYDDGSIMISLGHEEPVVSMDRSGKIVWAKNNDILLANIKKGMEDIPDGETLPIAGKELGSCEVYPQSVSHDSTGRLLSVCGDGEYIIYTALALKNKSFGHALEFVWGVDSGVYATRESSSRVQTFKNFKTHKQFRPPFAAEGVFGGNLLGIRSSDFIDFYDWEECRIIRRIDVCPRRVYWSESGEVVVLCCDANFYVLRYNHELVSKFLDQNVEIGEQGIENSFILEQEVADKVRNGYFTGDCFIYTTSAGRLNYYVGGEVMTLAHLDKAMYLLGYIPKNNRVYLMDKSYNIYSYSLLVSILLYQTAIVRQDFEAAEKVLGEVPKDHWNRIAHFLESQGHKELALEVSVDPEHKFELALTLHKFDLARQVLLESESDQKWKQLGDIALSDTFDIKLAEECFTRSRDLSSLLLIYSSLGNKQGLRDLAKQAVSDGRNNIAFCCLYLLNDIAGCIRLLSDTGRIPEAAFFARTFAPSKIHDVLALWRDDLKKVSDNASLSLANPFDYPEQFPQLQQANQLEEYVQQRYEHTANLPSSLYFSMRDEIYRVLVTELKDGVLGSPSDLPSVDGTMLNMGDDSVPDYLDPPSSVSVSGAGDDVVDAGSDGAVSAAAVVADVSSSPAQSLVKTAAPAEVAVASAAPTTASVSSWDSNSSDDPFASVEPAAPQQQQQPPPQQQQLPPQQPKQQQNPARLHLHHVVAPNKPAVAVVPTSDPVVEVEEDYVDASPFPAGTPPRRAQGGVISAATALPTNSASTPVAAKSASFSATPAPAPTSSPVAQTTNLFDSDFLASDPQPQSSPLSSVFVSGSQPQSAVKGGRSALTSSTPVVTLSRDAVAALASSAAGTGASAKKPSITAALGLEDDEEDQDGGNAGLQKGVNGGGRAVASSSLDDDVVDDDDGFGDFGATPASRSTSASKGPSASVSVSASSAASTTANRPSTAVSASAAAPSAAVKPAVVSAVGASPAKVSTTTTAAPKSSASASNISLDELDASLAELEDDPWS